MNKIENEISNEKRNLDVAKGMLKWFGIAFAITLPLGTTLCSLGASLAYNSILTIINSFILTLGTSTIILGGFSLPFIIQLKYSKRKIKKLEEELKEVKKEEKNNKLEKSVEKSNSKDDVKIEYKQPTKYTEDYSENKTEKEMQKKLVLNRRNKI